MKKTLLILTLIIIRLALFSQEFANEKEIKNIALKYIDSKLAKNDTTQFQIKSIKYQDFNNHKSYYIVNLKPTGHVLMSAYSLERNYKHLKILIL